MIPAGLEKAPGNNNILNCDDSSSGDEYEDYEGFVFDFKDKKKNVKNIKNDENGPSSLQDNSNGFKFELNNNYFYEEKNYVEDDLKNAILHNNDEKFKSLFEKFRLDANLRLKTNWTPLMYAASRGNYEIVSYLIEKGADVNFSDDSFNVLLSACSCIEPNTSEHTIVKIVNLLISNGALIETSDKFDQTPLMYASRVGNCTLIDFLVELGADLNAQDGNSWTSLSHASSKGHLKCVQKLLQLGADPLIYTSDYFYPYDLAENAGFLNIKLLIKRFIRVKKIDSLKTGSYSSSTNDLIDFDVDEEFADEEVNDGLLFEHKKSLDDDLENFLGLIKLKGLKKLFTSKKINLIDLLNFKDEDLINCGVDEDFNRQLILTEVKKFHKKNWKSSSLIPVRHETYLNSNEILAIASNLSRNLDYMCSNVNYISNEATDFNKELFSDKFLNSKLLDALEQTVKNCKCLLKNVESLCTFVETKVEDRKIEPVNLVKTDGTKKKWFEDKVKLSMLGTIGLTFTVSSIYFFKFSN